MKIQPKYARVAESLLDQGISTEDIEIVLDWGVDDNVDSMLVRLYGPALRLAVENLRSAVEASQVDDKIMTASTLFQRVISCSGQEVGPMGTENRRSPTY